MASRPRDATGSLRSARPAATLPPRECPTGVHVALWRGGDLVAGDAAPVGALAVLGGAPHLAGLDELVDIAPLELRPSVSDGHFGPADGPESPSPAS